MNPDPTQENSTADTGTDGLKFDLPPGQTPGAGLGTGQTGMRDFNPDDPNTDTQAERAAWNKATGDGQKSEQVSTRDQDNSTA